jgi:hypothetical protein
MPLPDKNPTTRLILPIWILVLIILSGCNQNGEGLLRQFTPPEDEASATNYISLLRQGGFEHIQKDMDSSMTNAETHDMLVKMAALIPAQEPISVKIIGAQQFNSDEIYKINLSFEYQFPTNWILINVALQRKAGITTIWGFHVRLIPDSLEHLNGFKLTGKNVFQYAIFGLAILIPIFILCALLLCILTKNVKRKWLWIIFILFGFGRITMNWTTGHWQFGLLYFQLFGAGAFAPLYGAWLITVSIPLGAIIFLLKRKQLTALPETTGATVGTNIGETTGNESNDSTAL